MPDEALFQAAKSGALGTPDQIAVQAQRMLKDDKARDGLRDFHLQWLALYGVDELEKDAIFTTYSPEVAKAMLAESSAFIDSVMRGTDATGKLEALFTSSTSFINEDAGQALRRHRRHRGGPEEDQPEPRRSGPASSPRALTWPGTRRRTTRTPSPAASTSCAKSCARTSPSRC